jgi:uncharacterized membrane protein YkvA (DUF1232 family)
MNDINTKFLDIFPRWLRSLGDDVRTIINTAADRGMDKAVRGYLVGGVNYLFKSLDLIPDGIDDIGYIDDAFVLRLSVKAALEGDIGSLDPELRSRLEVLAGDVADIEEFLPPEVFRRLDTYTRNLKNGAARGRMVDEIVESSRMFQELADEANAFVQGFSSPSFSRDEKNLIKLTAFLEAKLPK